MQHSTQCLCIAAQVTFMHRIKRGLSSKKIVLEKIKINRKLSHK